MSETFTAPGADEVNRTAGGSPAVLASVLIGAGAYLVWFGVHYWRSDTAWPSDPVKAVLTGKPIPTPDKGELQLVEPSAPIPLAAVTGSAGGAGTAGDRISAAALRYQGAGYAWGGNASVPGDWDCSSFVSKVLGQDLGLPLPGGGSWGSPGYPPNSHGPGSTQYMLYGVGITAEQVQPGDLIVSTGHIGIAISPIVNGVGQMISAEDPQDGTRVGTFPAGFPEGPPVYRRVAFPTTRTGGGLGATQPNAGV